MLDSITHPDWPQSLDPRTLQVIRTLGDTVALLDSQPFKGLGLEAPPGGAAGEVILQLHPPRFATSIATLVECGRTYDGADTSVLDEGKPILRMKAIYEDGDSVVTDFLVGTHTRNWIPGGNFCAGHSNVTSYVRQPTNPLVIRLYADKGQSGAFDVFYDMQELRLPGDHRNKRLAAVDFRSLELSHNCSLYGTSGLFGASAWARFRSKNRNGDAVSGLKQNDPGWKDQRYGGYFYNDTLYGDEATIQDLGCGLTCLTMMNNYFGAAGTPDYLNDWLQHNRGYSTFYPLEIDSLDSQAEGSLVRFRWNGYAWPPGQSFVVEMTDFVPAAVVTVVDTNATGGHAEITRSIQVIPRASFTKAAKRSDVNVDVATRGFSDGAWTVTKHFSSPLLADTVEQALADSLPVMLWVDGGKHQVLATGMDVFWASPTEAHGTYSIADPALGTGLLYPWYGNIYIGAAIGSRLPGHPFPTQTAQIIPPPTKGLSVIVDGPTHCDITVPGGGSINFDAGINDYVSTIANSFWLRQFTNINTTDPSLSGPPHDVFWIPDASAGEYSVRITGHGAGRSCISVEAYDLGGNSSSAFQSIATSSAQTTWMRVSYAPSAPISVEIQSALSTDASSPPKGLSIRAWPNPGTSRVMVSWEVDRAGTGSVDIFDLSGRRLVTLASGSWSVGPISQLWTAVDAAGQSVRPGVYFARLMLDHRIQSTRFVLVGTR